MDKKIFELITSPPVQQFIREHENDDAQAIVLKNRTLFGLPSPIIANQIRGRKKSLSKIPSFASADVVFPPGLNLEQASSEITARFKKEVLTAFASKRNVLSDITGGFGVDAFFVHDAFDVVNYVEPDPALLEIVQYNHRVRLGATNISHHLSTAEVFLSGGISADVIYIDPSRRNESRKVFALADCTPNAVELLPTMMKLSPIILIKVSPLLDIKLAVSELMCVKNVFVVAIDNEVKELLFLLQRGFDGEPLISSVNFVGQQRETFDFYFSEEASIAATFSDPQEFLYEPNSAILKAGAFKCVMRDFAIEKIHMNTHLYTARFLFNDFPGRIFRLISEVKPDKRSLSVFFPDGKANVATRNYPLSVAELKKKTGLNDGGEKYLLGFTARNKKYLCAAERLK